MVFSIQHTFKKVSETKTSDTYSPYFSHGPTCWYLCIRTEKTDLKEEFCLILFGSPQDEVQNDTLFEITANYKLVITSHVEGKADYTKKDKEVTFHKDQVGEETSYGNELYSIPFVEIKKNGYHLLKNDEMTVSVDIDIVSIKGIDYFPLYTFENEFQDSDLTLSFKFPDFPYDTTFHLHSQILYLHSEYFKEFLQKECEEQIKVEQTQVVQKAGKKNLVVDLEDKFDPYLIRTYFSILYSSGYNLINEFNVKNLLKLNFIWKSKTILAHVDMFFVSNLDLLEIPIEEIIVLAWKHNLTTLKLIVLKRMTSIDLFKKISKLEDYQNLDKDCKVDLTEQIVLKEIIKK